MSLRRLRRIGLEIRRWPRDVRPHTRALGFPAVAPSPDKNACVVCEFSSANTLKSSGRQAGSVNVAPETVTELALIPDHFFTGKWYTPHSCVSC